MTGREMTAERLADIREETFGCLPLDEATDLWGHIDALAAKLDEARSKAAFATERATVAESERDALINGLGFIEAGRDGRGSAPIYERGIVRVYAGGYDGWVCARESEAGRSTVHFDGLGEALAHAVTEEIIHARTRADAAEKKLEALNAWADEVLATLDDAAVVDVYGYPESGDPRLFTPDPEACTPEEIAAHAAALAAVEAGAEPADLPATWTQDGERLVHMHQSPWGIGTYRWTDEDAAERRDRLDAALRAARGGE